MWQELRKENPKNSGNFDWGHFSKRTNCPLCLVCGIWHAWLLTMELSLCTASKPAFHQQEMFDNLLVKFKDLKFKISHKSHSIPDILCSTHPCTVAYSELSGSPTVPTVTPAVLSAPTVHASAFTGAFSITLILLIDSRRWMYRIFRNTMVTTASWQWLCLAGSRWWLQPLLSLLLQLSVGASVTPRQTPWTSIPSLSLLGLDHSLENHHRSLLGVHGEPSQPGPHTARCVSSQRHTISRSSLLYPKAEV